MKTINEICSAFKLGKNEVQKLSREAKSAAIDCGKKGLSKELPSATWNLFDNISDKVWYSNLEYAEKRSLGFGLFELFPSYYHFLQPFYHAILKGEIDEPAEKDIIWKQFSRYLGAENFYAEPVGYVLWVNFFEDTSLVREAWQGVLRGCISEKAKLKLLDSSGPVPYELKETLFNLLLPDKSTHQALFQSLLFSIQDLYGQIDKEKAKRLLPRLKIDHTSEACIFFKTQLDKG